MEQAAQQRAQEAQQQIEPQITSLQQEIDTTTAALSALQGQQASSSQAAALSAHLSALQLHLVLLQWTLEQNQLNAVVLTPLVFIQSAQPDTSPAHSRLTQDVLNGLGGATFGLVFAVFMILLRTQLTQRVVVSRGAVEAVNWPVLGALAIPKDAAAAAAAPLTPSGSSDGNDRRMPRLQQAIEFASINQPLRSLLVTSATLNNQPAATAAVLAQSMARGGKRIVLVDADYRAPAQDARFGVVPQVGLSDAALALKLSGSQTTDLLRYLARIYEQAGLPLRVMTSGTQPPNAATLLESPATAKVLELLAADADLVIVCAPPVIPFPDAEALAPRLDGVVMVVDPRHERASALQRANVRLAESGAHVLGAIVNDPAAVESPVVPAPNRSAVAR
jgi:Mrp family chromosome partitioning ATPase